MREAYAACCMRLTLLAPGLARFTIYVYDIHIHTSSSYTYTYTREAYAACWMRLTLLAPGLARFKLEPGSFSPPTFVEPPTILPFEIICCWNWSWAYLLIVFKSPPRWNWNLNHGDKDMFCWSFFTVWWSSEQTLGWIAWVCWEGWWQSASCRSVQSQKRLPCI